MTDDQAPRNSLRLLHLLGPTSFEIDRTDSDVWPDAEQIRSEIPYHKRLKTRVSSAAETISISCPMSGITLQASLVEQPNGSVLRGEIRLHPWFRLAIVAFFVVVATPVILVPLLTMIEIIRDQAPPENFLYSLVAAGFLVLLGIICMGAQAYGRKVGEQELVTAIRRASRRQTRR